MTKLETLDRWVADVARLTKPDHIHWCDGSEAEYDALVEKMLAAGDLIELNPRTHPNCYLHHSDPSDVARVEHLTFICTTNKDDAGPNNHWMDPTEAHAKIDALFDGCMKGRTLYVIPYCMGPIDSPLSRCGVEITDSPYVVANMRIMTRMGAPALARIERDGTFVKGLHSTGELDPHKRFIMHFPEELTIKSIGSGYGGNALLGKKCHALRIGSLSGAQGRLARRTHAHRRHPESARRDALHRRRVSVGVRQDQSRDADSARRLSPKQGWKVWTVGDDICWMTPGADGRLWAINPEAGYFGVAPGTSEKTNPNALAMLNHDTIFTNVAMTADGQPWWEGLPGTPVKDWQGRDYDPPAAARPRIRIRASPCRRNNARATRRTPKIRRACRFPRSSSADAASISCRSSSKRATGPMASSSAPRWDRKPRLRRPAPSACCAATRWR